MKARNDSLVVDVEEFHDEDLTVMSIGRGNESLWIYQNEDADIMYRLLMGDDDLMERIKNMLFYGNK